MGSDGGQKNVDVMHAALKETWDRLNEIWAKVGYDADVISRRRKKFTEHVTELLGDMKQEGEERLNEQQKKLDLLMEEILQLSNDLSMAAVPELGEASGKPLLEMEKVFVDIANQLRKQKGIRMEKYNKINDQVLEVCEELDEIPMKIEFNGIPADSQVVKLDQHLGYLRHEKSRRLEVYKEYKIALAELLELLERSPASHVEELAQSDEINLNHPVSMSGLKALSQTVLAQLEEIISDLKDQLQENKQIGENYWQKIRELWSRLNEDEEIINAFTEVHQSISTQTWQGVYTPSVLKGLHKELERLEEEKKRNMSLFIKQVREELCELWLSKCFMTTVEIRFTESNYAEITPFTISDFTSDFYEEELLEKHEKEVEYWRDFVERNKKIIDGVNRRSHMFAQYKTLDQKSDDPSRLANRGGALLKEEKERKKLEKTIPKLESELKQMCEEFELEADAGHGMTKFLVYGRTVHEMIEQDWEEFHEEKRIRKESKKKPEAGGATNKSLMTTQLGNTVNRKRPHTPSSVQRGAVTPNKRNRTQIVTPAKTAQSPFLHPSASTSKRPFANAPRSSKPKSNSNQYFHPNMSATKTASRKALRKSIRSKRKNNGSSLMSDPSSNQSSTSSNNKSSLSEPNLKLRSLEQLDFSKVIRGTIQEVMMEQQKTPKRASSKENFAQPSASGITRSAKKTPTKPGSSMLTRHASVGKIPMPTKLTGKEQVQPASDRKYVGKDAVISPVASYSEFTDHLLCQSTLNSSAVVPIKSGAATTPTKSAPGMAFTPAKLPLSDNRF